MSPRLYTSPLAFLWIYARGPSLLPHIEPNRGGRASALGRLAGGEEGALRCCRTSAQSLGSCRTRTTHSRPGVDGHTRVFVRQRRRWVASVARVGERVAHGAEGIVATRCKWGKGQSRAWSSSGAPTREPAMAVRGEASTGRSGRERQRASKWERSIWASPRWLRSVDTRRGML
jgi:hypothetical protein